MTLTPATAASRQALRPARAANADVRELAIRQTSLVLSSSLERMRHRFVTE
jgi:hypothetical protein